MEKHEKLAKLYLTLIAIIGITIGYLDTKEIDFIYLIVCGIGMLCVSVLIGSAFELSYSAIFKKRIELNFNEKELKIIPHHLYGHINNKEYSVNHWIEDVQQTLFNIQKRNKILGVDSS